MHACICGLLSPEMECSFVPPARQSELGRIWTSQVEEIALALGGIVMTMAYLLTVVDGSKACDYFMPRHWWVSLRA